MKLLALILVVLLFSISSSAFCQTPKQFLGTWTTKRSDARSHSVTEETWIFQTSKTGIWQRKLIMPDGAVICDVSNPFSWKLTSASKLEMTLGKTTCKCSAAQKKFEEGLDEFVKNYKEVYTNEYFSYKIKKVDPKSIVLDDFTLEKQ